ncbi:MFS transporter [Rossellomorea oryzaecorticis]|uniref:MFS transporter n=1 Tax=Rossellomorea oryzaecorticis TaxID=1396505 RepID=A0ABU9KF55_9BACI
MKTNANFATNEEAITRCRDSSEHQQALYKKTLIIIMIAQVFGGAGLAAGITVGALLAQDMLGTDSFSGVPVALFTLGSAGAALFVGRLSQKHGRRIGLSIGFIIGGIGAIGAVAAAVTNSITLLFISLLIYGAGTATNLQTRYAGTDLAKPSQRATAVSFAMVSTTFGAVAGPNLVDVMGRFAESIGIPPLGGPFILAFAAYTLAGIVIYIFMRPDPYVVAKALSVPLKAVDDASSSEAITASQRNKRGVFLGSTVMILTQIVMVAVMTMTPVHMGHHGHGLTAIGLIIGIHIGAMYLPSLVTGILVDKIGRMPMVLASAVTLLAAGILAAMAPTDSIAGLAIALALLGLGWNFGLISGTAILVDSTDPATRAKTQGSVDVFVALAGASGGVLSGIIVAFSSYPALSIGGGVVSLILIPVMIWFLAGSRSTDKA